MGKREEEGLPSNPVTPQKQCELLLFAPFPHVYTHLLCCGAVVFKEDSARACVCVHVCVCACVRVLEVGRWSEELGGGGCVRVLSWT